MMKMETLLAALILLALCKVFPSACQRSIAAQAFVQNLIARREKKRLCALETTAQLVCTLRPASLSAVILLMSQELLESPCVSRAMLAALMAPGAVPLGMAKHSPVVMN